MGKTIPWHGKKSKDEDKCPHCGAYNMWTSVSKTVMELSAQHYKVCTNCQGKYVETYLVCYEDNEIDAWSVEGRYDNPKIDQAELFDELIEDGVIHYDDDNPNPDSDYYDIPPQSIHFIKGEDDG
jgi:hypothetical protein